MSLSKSPTKTADMVAYQSLGMLAKKPDNIAQLLCEDEYLDKLTELRENETFPFAQIYHLFDTITAMNKAESVDAFEPVPLQTVMQNLYRNRVSLKRQGRHEVRDVSKVHIQQEEIKPPEKKGLFGWLKK